MASPDLFTVGWICGALPERLAAECFLDETYTFLPHVSSDDQNSYTIGRIGHHHVVIAYVLDAEYGTASAASVVKDMIHSFPNIKIGLLVGLGGGAPSEKNDIRLGDVVVSAASETDGGILQFNFDMTTKHKEFKQTAYLNSPPVLLRTAVTELKARHASDGNGIEDAVNAVLTKFPQIAGNGYARPDSSRDQLFTGDNVQAIDTDDESWSEDEPWLIERIDKNRKDNGPAVHYGIIASSSRLIKDGEMRDKLASQKNVMCFETGAAGLMSNFPCFVIRGICDYADSHKTHDWHGYAAMVAAAYAKALLERIPVSGVEELPRIQVAKGNGTYNDVDLASLW